MVGRMKPENVSLRACIEIAKAASRGLMSVADARTRLVQEIILIDNEQDVLKLMNIISTGADEEGEG